MLDKKIRDTISKLSEDEAYKELMSKMQFLMVFGEYTIKYDFSLN
jgi:hypothetical protein